MTLLRSVVNAHHADITALAASRELGLVATGGADATLHIWDLAVRYIQWQWHCVCEREVASHDMLAFAQDLRLEAQLKGHHAEITAVAFVDPYPLLVSADCAGHVMLW